MSDNDFVGIDDLPTPPKRTEYLRLENARVYVPTEEERRSDYVMAFLELVYTPVSYKLNGIFGDKEIDRYPVSWGLEDGDVAAVNDKGYFGVPADKARHRNGGKPRSEFDVLTRAFKAANIDFGFSRKTGQPVAPIGHILEMSNDLHDVGGNKVYERWVRTPIRVADDYVPGDSIREVTRGQTQVEAAPTARTGGPAAAELRAAVTQTGLIGQTPAELASSATQMRIISGARLTAPVLLSTEVSDAAADGKLVEYLLGRGVVALDNDGRLVLA